jgi:hypothetical protein
MIYPGIRTTTIMFGGRVPEAGGRRPGAGGRGSEVESLVPEAGVILNVE